MSAFSLYLVNDHKNDFHHIDLINPHNFTSKKYDHGSVSERNKKNVKCIISKYMKHKKKKNTKTRTRKQLLHLGITNTPVSQKSFRYLETVKATLSGSRVA